MLKQVLTSLFALLFVAASAQEIDELLEMSLEDLMNLDVVSTSKKGESFYKSPATIYVITKEDIKLRGYTDLKDILRDIPAFDYTYHFGLSSITSFSVRGISGGAGNLLFFKDGIKQSSPAGRNLPFGNQMPLDNVKQIEIIIGPASVLYGQDTYSGMINIITDKEESFVQVSTGSFNTIAPSANLHFPTKTGHVLISGRYYKSNGYSLYDQYPEIYKDAVDDWKNMIPDWQNDFDEDDMTTDAFKDNYNARFEIKHNKFTFGIINSRLHEAKGTGWSPTRYFLNHNTALDRKGTQVYTTYEDELSDKLTSKTTMVYNLEKTGNDYRNAYLTPQTWDGVVNPAGKSKYFYFHNTSLSIEEQFIYTVSDKFVINTGGVMESIATTPATENFLEPKDLKERIDSYNFQNFGAYLQGGYDLTDRYKIILGARADYNTNYGLVPNYNAGFMLNPVDKLNIKLLFGTAYRQPSTADLYEENYTNTSANLGNPDLNPERIKTFEAALFYNVTKSLMVSVDAYHNKASDIISRRTIGQDSLGRNVRVKQNVNSMITTGVDFAVKYKFKKAFTFDAWYAFLEGHSLNYSSSSDDLVKTPISKISKHKVNIGASYVIKEKFGIHLNTHWVDQISTSSGNSEFTEGYMPGYTNIDLNLSYLADKFEVGLYVNNLLDQKIYHAGPGTQRGTSMPKAPQPLRNVMVRAAYKL